MYLYGISVSECLETKIYVGSVLFSSYLISFFLVSLGLANGLLNITWNTCGQKLK